MDKDRDQDLFYIAKEGLKAPLPPPSARFLVVRSRQRNDVYLHCECGLDAWRQKSELEPVRKWKAGRENLKI